MATFLFLYTGVGDTMAADDAERAASTKAWGAWFERIGDALVDAGNPFTPALKTISKHGEVSDASAPVTMTGYSVIKAYSHAIAAEIAKDCPVLQDGGQVLVYETFPVM